MPGENSDSVCSFVTRYSRSERSTKSTLGSSGRRPKHKSNSYLYLISTNKDEDGFVVAVVMTHDFFPMKKRMICVELQQEEEQVEEEQ